MKKLSTLLMQVCALACVVLFFAGCCTYSRLHYGSDPQAVALTQQARFKVVSLDNHEGWCYESAITPLNFNVSQKMKACIVDELNRKGIYGETWTLAVSILAYKPGNAFKRWLWPLDFDEGETYLSIRGDVFDPNGRFVSSIITTSQVPMGGLFTVGAYESVFSFVANDFVKSLTDVMRFGISADSLSSRIPPNQTPVVVLPTASGPVVTAPVATTPAPAVAPTPIPTPVVTPAPTPPPPVAPPVTHKRNYELEKRLITLKSLFDQRILTAQEYEQAKKRILSE